MAMDRSIPAKGMMLHTGKVALTSSCVIKTTFLNRYKKVNLCML